MCVKWGWWGSGGGVMVASFECSEEGGSCSGMLVVCVLNGVGGVVVVELW